jgi:hypothetical protein
VSGNLARKLIATFDRYEYRKAQSPDIDEIREQVDRAIRHGSPVQFVGFWGVGTRTALADPDIQALGRLGHLLKRLNEVVEGVPTNVSMMLWLADVHGRGNGISDIGMDQYFKEVTALAASYKIETQRLSEIWLRAEIPADAADILQRAPKVQDMWERFPLQEDLIRQANTRCQCPENPELCAFRYYCTRLAENPALARMFEGCIQFTYSRPTHIDLLPKLPTLFWHSTKAGRSAMPWFS